MGRIDDNPFWAVLSQINLVTSDLTEHWQSELEYLGNVISNRIKLRFINRLEKIGPFLNISRRIRDNI